MLCEQECKLSCKGCKVFNLESKSESTIEMTWEGVRLCVEYICQEYIEVIPGCKLDCIIGVARGGLFPALWISEIMELQYGVYYPICGEIKTDEEIVLKNNVIVIDDIEDSSSTLACIEEKNPEIKEYITLIKRKGNEGYSQAAVILDDARWVIFPWERL